MSNGESSGKQKYKRLPGKRFRPGWFFKTSLWLGEDHLLHIRSRGYSEEYKRYYFQDIQAILLRKTFTATILNIIWGIVSALCLLVLITEAKNWGEFLLVAWSVLTAFALIAFFETVLRGPSCVCHIQTAVHREELPTLSRIRSAMKAIAVMIERIEAKQGFLSPEQLASIRPLAGQFPIAPGPGLARDTKLSFYGGNAHLILFGFMLFIAIETLLPVFFHLPFLIGFTGVLSLVFWILVVTALIRQRQSTITPTIKSLVWLSVGLSILLGIFLSGYGVIYAMTNPSNDVWRIVRIMQGVWNDDSTTMRIYRIIASTLYSVIGMIGLILVLRYRSIMRIGEQ